MNATSLPLRLALGFARRALGLPQLNAVSPGMPELDRALAQIENARLINQHREALQLRAAAFTAAGMLTGTAPGCGPRSRWLTMAAAVVATAAAAVVIAALRATPEDDGPDDGGEGGGRSLPPDRRSGAGRHPSRASAARLFRKN